MNDEIDRSAESAPEGDTSAQTMQALAILRASLTQVGAQMPDVAEDEVAQDIEEAIPCGRRW